MSVRAPVKHAKDVVLSNFLKTAFIDMPVIPGFKEAIADSIACYQKMKSSLYPYGILFCQKIPVQLPYTLPKMILLDSTDKLTTTFSNLNISTKSISFDGKRDLEHFLLINGYGNLGTGLVVGTIGTRMNVNCFSDEVNMENPQELCDIFARKNKEILAANELI